MTHEARRLNASCQRTAHWKRWGPYLSARAWGTMREDDSPSGTAWDSLTHDQALSKVYRWGDDGIGGIGDRHQLLCVALARWKAVLPFSKNASSA